MENPWTLVNRVYTNRHAPTKCGGHRVLALLIRGTGHRKPSETKYSRRLHADARLPSSLHYNPGTQDENCHRVNAPEGCSLGLSPPRALAPVHHLIFALHQSEPADLRLCHYSRGFPLVSESRRLAELVRWASMKQLLLPVHRFLNLVRYGP